MSDSSQELFNASAVKAGWKRIVNVGREQISYTRPYVDLDDGLRLMRPGQNVDNRKSKPRVRVKRFEVSEYLPPDFVARMLVTRLGDAANPGERRIQQPRLFEAPQPGRAQETVTLFGEPRQVCKFLGHVDDGTAQPDPIVVVNGTERITYPGLTHSVYQAILYLRSLRRRQSITGYLRVDRRPVVQDYGTKALRLYDYNVKRQLKGEPTVNYATMLSLGDPDSSHSF